MLCFYFNTEIQRYGVKYKAFDMENNIDEQKEQEREWYNNIGAQILDSCIQVHKEFGAGLLESAYQFALLTEFKIRNIKAVAKVPVPLYYKGNNTDKHFELDILVEDKIIMELKSVEVLHPVYEAQLITYLKLANMKLGYLVNFNVPLLKDGFKRFIRDF